jgi:hypothetical protein
MMRALLQGIDSSYLEFVGQRMPLEAGTLLGIL